jgi:hypothetical protein
MCVCARAHTCAYVKISATVHCCFCIGLCAVFWAYALFSVFLVLNAAFIRSTNSCLCQPNPQPESSWVAVESGWGRSKRKWLLTGTQNTLRTYPAQMSVMFMLSASRQSEKETLHGILSS